MSSQYPPIITETLSSSVSFDMIFVEGGEFKMGALGNDQDADSDEKPSHAVRISSFYMGKFLVTQDVWEIVSKYNPSRFKGHKRPTENISWNDIVKNFLPHLSHRTNRNYRLPTEAEWEFAARGGLLSEGYKFAGSDKLKEVGWYADNSDMKTQEVGGKYANELGLYDMSGNVWEWCEDYWHDNYKGAPKDGSAWIGLSKQGYYRVNRGGGYLYIPKHCRVTYRNCSGLTNRSDYLGFRLVFSLDSLELSREQKRK